MPKDTGVCQRLAAIPGVSVALISETSSAADLIANQLNTHRVLGIVDFCPWRVIVEAPPAVDSLAWVGESCLPQNRALVASIICKPARLVQLDLTEICMSRYGHNHRKAEDEGDHRKTIEDLLLDTVHEMS